MEEYHPLPGQKMNVALKLDIFAKGVRSDMFKIFNVKVYNLIIFQPVCTVDD